MEPNEPDSVLQFYQSLASDYHLIFAEWQESVRWQGEMLDEIIRASLGRQPASLLDCTCGIGTQAIGLALRGYTVHATDLSRAAVERARREAASLGASLTFGVADLRTLATAVHFATHYWAILRHELSRILGEAGFMEIAWQMSAESCYYQPVVRARKP